MAHFRVFARPTRFCVGFDWVRLALFGRRLRGTSFPIVIETKLPHRSTTPAPPDAWPQRADETIGPDRKSLETSGNDRPVSTGRPIETIGPDRTFSDILGHRHRLTRVYMADLLWPRARMSRPLSLPPRFCDDKRAARRWRASNPPKNRRKIFSPAGFSLPRALRVCRDESARLTAACPVRRVS